MERVDADLNHEQQQKYRRHLEESPDIDQVAEIHPRPGNCSGTNHAQYDAGHDSRIVNLKQHEHRFHSFFGDHDQREEKHAEQRQTFG